MMMKIGLFIPVTPHNPRLTPSLSTFECRNPMFFRVLTTPYQRHNWHAPSMATWEKTIWVDWWCQIQNCAWRQGFVCDANRTGGGLCTRRNTRMNIKKKGDESLTRPMV